MLFRELGRRLGLRQRSWPRALRSKWFGVVLLVLFFWGYEVFSLWDKPIWTAWLIINYFLAAFAIDARFTGASFCKYVCPIGQFQFVASLVSPLEVKVREPGVCATCKTHDCLRGNERQRGCEMELYLPRKSGNLDCTFCLDCVRACPHDNIGSNGGRSGHGHRSGSATIINWPFLAEVGHRSPRVGVRVRRFRQRGVHDGPGGFIAAQTGGATRSESPTGHECSIARRAAPSPQRLWLRLPRMPVARRARCR